MNQTTRRKLAVDLGMAVLLFVLIVYQLTGDFAHEWAGAGMFLLFLLHHILNGGWYRGIFRGNYPPIRVLQLAVNLLAFLAMLGLMVSGVILSSHVFAFLSIRGGDPCPDQGKLPMA